MRFAEHVKSVQQHELLFHFVPDICRSINKLRICLTLNILLSPILNLNIQAMPNKILSAHRQCDPAQQMHKVIYIIIMALYQRTRALAHLRIRTKCCCLLLLLLFLQWKWLWCLKQYQNECQNGEIHRNGILCTHSSKDNKNQRQSKQIYPVHNMRTINFIGTLQVHLYIILIVRHSAKYKY